MNAQKQRIAAQGMQEKNAMVRERMEQKAQDNAMNRNMKAQQFDQKMRQPMNPRGGARLVINEAGGRARVMSCADERVAGVCRVVSGQVRPRA